MGTGYLMICRMNDLPIELKDKNLNVEEKIKTSPRTFLPGSGRSPPKISESEVRVIDKKTDHFIHYDEENIEFNEPTPQPVVVVTDIVDDSGHVINPDDVLETEVVTNDDEYGRHRNMIGNFMMNLRKPAVTKAEEKTKKKDEKLIETYLARMKLPALTPEQEEEKR